MPLRPAHPRPNDRVFRTVRLAGGLYAVRRFRCIEAAGDGSPRSRWLLEHEDNENPHETEALAERAADHLNRAEPWYDPTLEPT